MYGDNGSRNNRNDSAMVICACKWMLIWYTATPYFSLLAVKCEDICFQISWCDGPTLWLAERLQTFQWAVINCITFRHSHNKEIHETTNKNNEIENQVISVPQIVCSKRESNQKFTLAYIWQSVFSVVPTSYPVFPSKPVISLQTFKFFFLSLIELIVMRIMFKCCCLF